MKERHDPSRSQETGWGGPGRYLALWGLGAGPPHHWCLSLKVNVETKGPSGSDSI